MRPLRRLWAQLTGTVTALRRENELAAEIEDHLQSLTEDNIRAGMPPAEARRAAVLKFGSVELTKEEYRDRRGLPHIDTLLQDLRFAVRSCRKRPAFVSVVVLSLAIGIGLNTTLFTWLKAVYLNPLPGVTAARELVTINAAYKFGDGYSNSFGDFTYIRDHSRLFSGLFAHETEVLAVSDGKSAEMTTGGIVSGNYFQVLHTKVAVGRTFRPDEDQVNDRNPVIVLSDRLWHTRFGATSSILGKTIELNRVPFSIIGVAAPGFIGVYGGLRQDFWIPLHMARALDQNHNDPLANGSWLEIMGRPKSGISVSAIQSELDVLCPQLRFANHKKEPDYQARVYPLHEAQRGFHSGLFEMVRVLAIAVVIILLLACLNAANLLIGRATDRAREISVRISLGAGRTRILRQLLTESVLIAGIAGVAGLLIVYATRSVPALIAPPGMEIYLNLGIDRTVVAFLFGITLVTSLVFGLLPALETARVDVVNSLKEGSGNITAGRRRNLWRMSLVIGQVAFTMAALFGAVLFAAHLHEVINAGRGFETRNILSAQTDLFAAGMNEARGQTFYRDSVERLESIPGIESAAWTTFLPMNGSGGGNLQETEVRGYASPAKDPLSIIVDSVSPGYLHALAIPVVRGREFKWSDTQTAVPVLIVNQKFVDEYLKGRDPIGAEVRIGNVWRSIVGVHRNYVYRDPAQPVRPTIFLPIAQGYSSNAIVVIRSKTNPSLLLPQVRRAIAAMDRNIPLANVMTMNDNVNFHFLERKIATASLTFFAVVACTLAAIGIYAVLGAYVNQRRREFGIRIALGALPRDMRTKVLLESAQMALIGSAIGVVLSAVLGKVLQSELFTINPFDPRLYAIAMFVMTVTVVGATIVPARAASNMDPISALRSE